MSQRFRQSSIGNPYHYPAGDPQGRGGQFAPKSYAEAAAVANGIYYENRDEFDAYRWSKEFGEDHHEYYHKNQTSERFSQPPTENQIEEAKRIYSLTKKYGGDAPPEGGTTRDYEDYITNNKYEANKPTEDQARAIRHLQEENNVQYSSDDKYGGSAGSFMGKAKTASRLLGDDAWEKNKADGCYYSITHDVGKSGKPGTQNLGYRLKPFKDENGKTRYNVQRRVRTGKKDENGKPVYDYRDISEIDKTGSSYASDPKEGRKVAASNELKRYAKSSGQIEKSKKHAPNKIEKTVKHMDAMGDAQNWKESDSGYSYSMTYDENNQHSYKVEQGTTGYRATRTVVNVQSASVYDPATGEMVKTRTPRTRTEVIGSGFATPEEAMAACQSHEANSIVHQRFKNMSANDIKKMKKDGLIKTESAYNKLLRFGKEKAKKK